MEGAQRPAGLTCRPLMFPATVHNLPAPRPHRVAGAGATEIDMSKGLDRKREDKKKPAKTAKEKKEAKREKKAGKPFAPA
jgi:hypothetical protein